MANWKKFTHQHGGHVGYVNMDRVEQVYRFEDYDINYQPNGKSWTKLVTNRGSVEAVEPVEHFLPEAATA